MDTLEIPEPTLLNRAANQAARAVVATIEEQTGEELSLYNCMPFRSSAAPRQFTRRIITPDQKEALDELHKRKIDLCDEVLVLNVGGYVGDSTRSEVEYAESIKKTVRWLEIPVATLAASA